MILSRCVTTHPEQKVLDCFRYGGLPGVRGEDIDGT